jgi:hypothetical protein
MCILGCGFRQDIAVKIKNKKRPKASLGEQRVAFLAQFWVRREHGNQIVVRQKYIEAAVALSAARTARLIGFAD